MEYECEPTYAALSKILLSGSLKVREAIRMRPLPIYKSVSPQVYMNGVVSRGNTNAGAIAATPSTNAAIL